MKNTLIYATTSVILSTVAYTAEEKKVDAKNLAAHSEANKDAPATSNNKEATSNNEIAKAEESLSKISAEIKSQEQKESDPTKTDQAKLGGNEPNILKGPNHSLEHLQNSIELLHMYEKQLITEMHNEISKKSTDDQILSVAKNIVRIQEALTVLKALENVHKQKN